ncbi:aldehyde-activating protein [Halovibrio salipaludis]|uniref:Aldehyde-activating protein n=1 Tax=Halovibrio salipaludis TaxID=2032626 RepID=A0A2A2FAY9_9GAMM|nr:GFA family protein [Halovibrio salipaludis]PAU81789.1 aldehyde-activating protein [Halovibrio salipaludis]
MHGKCLCGSIQVTAPDQDEISVCHCTMCRRWGGAPMFAVHCGPEVQFSGSATPSTYRSSEWAERGFCPSCGTHLYFHYLPQDDYVLAAGLFQDPEDFRITGQIFIDDKPSYYALANETETLTGEQVIAQFGGASSS